MPRAFLLGLGLLSTGLIAAPSPRVSAAPVAEAQRVAVEESGSLRDAQHRNKLQIRIWYPAADDAVERPLVIGPPIGHCSMLVLWRPMRRLRNAGR